MLLTVSIVSDLIEGPMFKATFGALGIVLAVSSLPALAQDTAALAPEQSSEQLSQTDLKAITDAQIGILKAAL
jgi:hypothetical protein